MRNSWYENRKGKYSRIEYLKSKLVLLVFLLFGFSSCYSVNEHTYLRIVFNNSKLNSIYLNNYIDNVRNNGIIVPDSIKEIFFDEAKISANERLIYFKSKPEEWYLINFDATPCWIEAIYNPSLSSVGIYDNRFTSKTELNRIKTRFEVEVLNKAESSGKKQHIADSMLYR